MTAHRVERLFIEKSVEDLPLTQRIRDRLPGIPVEVVDRAETVHHQLSLEIDPVSTGKKSLLISRHHGGFLKKCPGTQGFICCNYWVLNAATGCPLDCSYCVLQSYLYNNPSLRIFANIEDLFAELRSVFSRAGNRTFRIGTGELTDSLALDPITGFSRDLVRFFSRQEKAILELKTKTGHVENLLGLEHGGRTMVAWSVNPEPTIASQEMGAAALESRLSAAMRCSEAGYGIAFHFDPILFDAGWEGRYAEVVERIFHAIPAERIGWISLGGLRFSPEVKGIIRKRFPRNPIVTGEFILCPDNKFRYLRSIRVKGYRKMVGWIRDCGPSVPIYLCMESRDVWEGVFKGVPREIENLAGIF